MTWEYLIGSEKDFEGAPDWCTQCVWTDKDGDSFIYWLNPETKTIYSPFWHMEPTCWNEEYGRRNYIKAERQAITALSWDGAGLPPVGCECEALIPYLDEPKSQWRKVKVIFSGDELDASGEFIVVDLENSRPYWTDQFRPLRTKEQIDREDAINEMARIMSGHPTITHEAIADLIFDAGYRKTK